MTRSQFYALSGHQIDQWIGGALLWQHATDFTQNFLIGRGARYAEHLGMKFLNSLGILPFPHATGHQDAAVLRDGFSNRLQTFSLGAVDKAAGIDDDHPCIMIVGGDFVSFDRELRQDSLRVHECFGTSQRNEAYLGRLRHDGYSKSRLGALSHSHAGILLNRWP